MAERIRVMHVTGVLGTGGVEESLWITAKFNNPKRYELAFVSCRRNEGYTAKRIAELGYKTYGLNVTNKMYDVRIIPALVKVIREFQPQVIHFYTKISIIGRIAAKVARVPIIICNEIDMDWEDWGLGLRIAAFIKRKLDACVDVVINCSLAVRRYWGGEGKKKYVVIYEPFDLSRFPQTVSAENTNGFRNGKYPVIGIISRVWPKKGHEYLIKAMPAIRNVFNDARLRITGTGPLMDEMKALTAALHLNGAVEFAGFVEDTREELQGMDVFVLPTLTEAFPLSVMEAMAAKVPVAASNTGGIPEQIEHGKTGMLFAMRNPDAIAESVIYILSHPGQARMMAQLGREKVIREFSPQSYMRKLDELYTEQLARKRQ